MLIEITLAIVLPPLLYLIINYVLHVMKLKDYPPGPFPLPVIGNLYLLGTQPYIDLANLAKKYGDVFSISFGMQRIVVINTIEPAREALITKGKIFAGRPSNFYTGDISTRGYKDIVFSDYGPVWKMVRKIAHSSLKMYGEGLHKLESLVVQESEDLHARLKQANGEPVKFHTEMGLSVLNVISAIVFGHHYNKDDAEFKQVVEFSSLVMSGLGGSDAVAFIPWLRFFPLEGLRNLRKGLQIRDVILRKKYLEHKDSFDENNMRDFIDRLLKVSSEEKYGKENFTRDHLEMIIADVFVGGSETTTTALKWCILYLIHWPKYQEKLYEEIIQVAGTDRYPDFNERPSLNLLQAVIHETMRFSSLAPLSILHKAMEKDEVGGISIPKDTLVLFNLWHIHHDEQYWENPNIFYPERWLESGIFTPGSRISYLAFSAGRRVCLGETLAKLELQTFLSRLIRDFRFEMPPDTPLPSLIGDLGLTLTPVHFSCVCVPRTI